MVTVAFLGDLGSGKTTLCIRNAILTKKINPIKRMFSNVHFNNYEYTPLDLMDLYLNHQEIRDTILVIDEIYTMMDSRLSGSHRNEIESYFIAMTRKAQADLFITMQYETFTDCRLSPFVKIKYIMEKILISCQIMIDGKPYYYTKPHPYKFKVHLFDERNTNNLVYREFIFDGRRWFKEFNTDQYILPPDDVIRRIKIRQMKDKLQYDKLLEKTNENKEIVNNGVKDAKRKTKRAVKKEDSVRI